MENISALTQRLFTPREFVERHSWIRMGGLRELLFNREYNGLSESGAIIALSSRKLLIDELLFLQWVESHRENNRRRK